MTYLDGWVFGTPWNVPRADILLTLPWSWPCLGTWDIILFGLKEKSNAWTCGFMGKGRCVGDTLLQSAVRDRFTISSGWLVLSNDKN